MATYPVTPPPAVTAAALEQTDRVVPVARRGLVSPMLRVGNDFDNAAGARLVLNHAMIVLGTPIGSLRMKKRFGSRFHLLRHQNVNVQEPMAEVYAVDALRIWEPRALVLGVQREQTKRKTGIVLWLDVVSGGVELARDERVFVPTVL